MTHTTGAAHAVSQMKLLPKDQWELKRYPGGVLAAGIYDNCGSRYWVKFAESDLPNDLISSDDLERFTIKPIDVPSVGKDIIARPEAFY